MNSFLKKKVKTYSQESQNLHYINAFVKLMKENVNIILMKKMLLTFLKEFVGFHLLFKNYSNDFIRRLQQILK
jgi:hypothetical protein